MRISIPAGDLAAVERQLRANARRDPNRCCGYFQSLTGASGIISDLPESRAFAARLPLLVVHGDVFNFNFLRLSLVQQSAEARYHLDSDAATALTGAAPNSNRRWISRLLLNLSRRHTRSLHYLDADATTVDIVVEGTYLRAAHPERLHQNARVAVIPPRNGPTVHGLVFESSRLLHSGVDGFGGHFVAAYGFEVDIDSSHSPARDPQNASRT